ncbi:MAG: hypothetical protein DRH04_04130 [Deltaproteobacteria bacterium]|nr:MAG: hypothetical protein DRH04_04130 [Deltaproteobacteria bacterium]
MGRGRPCDLLLVFGLQAAKGVGERRADLPPVHFLGQRRGKPLGEPESSGHPTPLAPAKGGDGGEGKPLLLPEILHHPGFVHGGEGPGRRVGGKQGRFGLGKGGKGLHHHRHGLDTLGEPGPVALESVQDLVSIRALGYHPERKRRELCVRDPALPGGIRFPPAQGFEGCAQILNRKEKDFRGGDRPERKGNRHGITPAPW